METRNQPGSPPSATASPALGGLGASGREQRLFDSLPVGIYRTTPEGRFLAVNRTLAEMLGFERAEDLLRTPAPSLWADPEERARFLKRLEIEGVVHGYEMRARRRDGTVFWVKNTVRRIGPEEGGVYFEGVIEDLSERRRLEEALAEAERRHRAMLDASPEAIAIHREGRFLYANRAAARLVGASDPSEILGRAPLEFVHPDFRPIVSERMERASRGEVTELLEEKFVRLDGEVIDVEVVALPVIFEGKPATQVLVRDVTDRKRAERRIRESEARLVEAQRLARLGNWEWNVLENRFAGSDEMYRLVGLEPGTEVDWEAGLGLVHPDDRGALEGALRRAAAEGAPFACEVRVVARGEVRTLQFNGKADRDSSGRVVRVVGTAQDVSERKRFEEALAEARDAALEASRLKSAFLANMSHEIRTPLNVILGYAAILAEELGRLGEERFREILGGIDRAGRRLLETVHNVLDLSKIESGSFSVHPRLLDAVALVKQAAHDFRPLAQAKGLSIALEIEEPEATVRFDEYCFSQALANLLSNAVKFTREGGVTVRLFREASGSLALEVRDTGVGIDSGYLPRLFEAFSQEQDGYAREFEGSGLGLALTRRYLELNGATIEVESEKGRGTTFRIRFAERSDLGRAVAAPLAPTGDAPEPAEPAAERASVLLLEDDPDTQLYMRALLGRRYEVVVAASAEEARRLLEEARPPSALLVDLSLGGEDGLSFVASLRRDPRWARLPIVATTAHAFVEDRQRCLAAGCDAYLAKPIDRRSLFETLEDLLARSRETT